MQVALLRAFGGPSLHSDHPSLLVRLEVSDADGSFDIASVERWLGCRLDVDEVRSGSREIVTATAVCSREIARRAGLSELTVSLLAGPSPGVHDIIVRAAPDAAMQRLWQACAEAVAALAAGETPGPVEDIVEEVRSLVERHALGPSTRAIVEAAERRGIPWERLDEGSLVRLGWGRHARLIRASVTGMSGSIAVETACDKALASRLLAAARLPVPRSALVATAEEAVEAAEATGYPVVVKPRDGNHGRGVSVNLETPEAVTRAFDIVRGLGRRALVEEQFSGRDFRVLVVGGRVVAAAERRPAHVVGDGRRSIEELVECENADPRRGEGHERPMTRIPLDSVALAHLMSIGLAPDSVPEAGRVVVICPTANLSRGASAHDVTDELHPSVRSICERAARAVGLDVCGVDLVAPTVSEPLPPGSGIVEVNASPGLRMHVHPAEGTPRDVGGAIVDHLYPPGAPARVPVIAVTGTNGKTTTTRLIAHGLSEQGKSVGMTSTGGITIGGEEVETGDTTGPTSARVVLADPTVDVAVLETARGGIVRRGLAFDRADVAVLTNVAEDHIGQDGIESIEDLYRIKRRVAELVRPGGWLVLNADDERLARLPEDPAIACVERSVFFYSTMPDNPVIRHHRARGGRALFARSGWIVEAAGDLERPIFRLEEAPITMGGAARFQTSNLLAASAALRIQGVRPSRVANAVRSFRARDDNAGRADLYRLGDGYVMLDYGHNPAGFAQVCQLAARWRRAGRRVTGVIGVPGDRADETIRNAARTAAAGFTRLIIREDEELRGRQPGEVPTILLDEVRRSAPAVPCTVIPVAADALSELLQDVRRGGIAVVFFEHLAPLRELLEGAGAQPADAVQVRAPATARVARRQASTMAGRLDYGDDSLL